MSFIPSRTRCDPTRPLSPPRTRDLTEAELARIPPEDRELVARLRREVYDAFEAAISKYEAEQ